MMQFRAALVQAKSELEKQPIDGAAKASELRLIEEAGSRHSGGGFSANKAIIKTLSRHISQVSNLPGIIAELAIPRTRRTASEELEESI